MDQPPHPLDLADAVRRRPRLAWPPWSTKRMLVAGLLSYVYFASTLTARTTPGLPHATDVLVALAGGAIASLVVAVTWRTGGVPRTRSNWRSVLVVGLILALPATTAAAIAGPSIPHPAVFSALIVMVGAFLGVAFTFASMVAADEAAGPLRALRAGWQHMSVSLAVLLMVLTVVLVLIDELALLLLGFSEVASPASMRAPWITGIVLAATNAIYTVWICGFYDEAR